MKMYWLPLAFFILQSCVKDEGQLPVAASLAPGDVAPTDVVEDSDAPVIVVGTDPLFAESWHLLNTGQTSYSTNPGTAGEDVNIEEVHALLHRGTGVRIAVSDTGVDTTHPDLDDNEIADSHRNYIFSNSSDWHGADPFPSDGEAHGTAVTGLIAAEGWNGVGSRGVAPEALWSAFRYIQDYSPGTSSIAMQLDQMEGDFDIFNYSYGSSECGFTTLVPSSHAKLLEGVTTLRSGKGAIYVQSAGNGFLASNNTILGCTGYYANTNIDAELTSPHKIIVGAINALGLKASYSTPGSGIWVSAPGGEDGTTDPAMVTTDIQGCSQGLSIRNFLFPTAFDFGSHADNLLCNYTNRMNGTSSAAPVVSGVIALMLEANSDLTFRDVKHILAMTADPIDLIASNTLTHPGGGALDLLTHTYDLRWTTNNAGRPFSNFYGFGRVNAEEAVNEALIYSTDLGLYARTIDPNSDLTYYDSGTLVGVTIPNNDFTGIVNSMTSFHNYIIEAVQVEFTTDHPKPRELAVHLISPAGITSRLLNINSGVDGNAIATGTLLMTNAFYNENSEGTWSIQLIDGSNTDVTAASLTNWKLIIHGHKEPIPVGSESPPTAITGLAPDVTPSISTTVSPLFTITDPANASVLRYEVSIVDSSNNVVADWYSIQNSMTFTTTLQGTNVFADGTYTVKVRSVDIDEEVSTTEFSLAWTVDIP